MMKILDVTCLGPEARQLIDAIERGGEREIVFVRDGQPIAKLMAPIVPSSTVQLGLAKGKFEVPGDIDSNNEEIKRMFESDEAGVAQKR